MSHTPGPWSVKFLEVRHRAGSPLCLEKCGRGAVPIRIEQDSPEDAARSGWPDVTELHVLQVDVVEDVIAADGTHVVCTGHDYDDSGSVSPDDARLIAAAPAMYDALLEVAHHADDECGFMVMVRAAIAKAEGQ